MQVQSAKLKANGRKMPRLDHGSHPAQEVVYGYKLEAIKVALEVHRSTHMPPLSDEMFDELALVMESAIARIRRYRQAELAGGEL